MNLWTRLKAWWLFPRLSEKYHAYVCYLSTSLCWKVIRSQTKDDPVTLYFRENDSFYTSGSWQEWISCGTSYKRYKTAQKALQTELLKLHQQGVLP